MDQISALLDQTSAAVERGTLREARAWLGEALQQAPADPRVRLAEVALELEAGEHETVLALCAELADRTDDAGLWARLYAAEAYLRAWELEEAARVAEELFALAHSTELRARAQLLLGRAAYAAGDLVRANTHFEAAMSDEECRLAAGLGRGQALSHTATGEMEISLAVTLVKGAQDERRDDPEIGMIYAEVLSRLHYPGYAESVRQATLLMAETRSAQRPRQGQPWLIMGQLVEQQREHNDALARQCYRQALIGETWWRYEAALRTSALAMREGAYSEAIGLLEMYLGFAPGNAMARQRLACAQLLNGNRQQASMERQLALTMQRKVA